MKAVARLTRGALLAQAREALTAAGVPGPEIDAERLLLHALGISRARLWSDRAHPVPDEDLARFARLLEARARRVPLQHLLGEVEFHAAAIEVEPGVFIPRPETERLVEVVLEQLASESGAAPEEGTQID